jgi:hypothetical protein
MNSGATKKIILRPQFNNDGSPKPVVLVGTNGSGKTGLLSTVADGLIEIASLHYQNITEHVGMNRNFFRILGSRTTSVGADFELSVLKFTENNISYCYRAKAGAVSSEAVAEEKRIFGSSAPWPPENQKVVVGPPQEVQRIFANGAYAFFPSTRFELPHWANVGALNRQPEGDFSPEFSNKLAKPIIVQSAIDEIKPWIMNIMLDTIVTVSDVMASPNLDTIRQRSVSNLTYFATYSSLNEVIKAVLRRNDASVSWIGRWSGDRRIAVIYGGDKIGIPSLDNLSAGQSTLLAIFGTLLRYGDSGTTPKPLEQIEGVFIIDEIDAHLHADLQHEALPQLMKLFPRVQFIVSSHSPLFPLGLRKLLGDDGFSLIELPSGLTIDPERYSEFDVSFSYFKETQAFEEVVQKKISDGMRPLILCEGETDPKYLNTAAELLGFERLSVGADFEWIGQNTGKGADGGGKGSLSNAKKFLINNPDFTQRKVFLVFDCDAGSQFFDGGNLHSRTLPMNSANGIRLSGIENLLPENVFEDRFFREEKITSGSDNGMIRKLRKIDLCNYLCTERREKADFMAFSGFLEEAEAILFPESLE